MQQRQDDQQRADRLAEDSSQRRAGHAHIGIQHQHDIQHNIDQAGANQEIQRTLGIPHRAQNTRANVIDERGNHTRKINADIGGGVCHHFLRRIHQPQNGRRYDNARDGQDQAAAQAHGNGRVHRAANAIFLPRTEILGDDHRSARGQAHKEAHNQIDQRAGSAADGCQRLLANKLTHHHCVHGVIQLLKEGTQQNGEKEQQHLLPDHALGDAMHIRGDVVLLENCHRECTPFAALKGRHRLSYSTKDGLSIGWQ